MINHRGGVWSATGHRPEKFGGYGTDTLGLMVLTAMNAVRFVQPDEMLVGMALGWDQAVATACYGLGVPFVACVPFKGQESRWRPEQQAVYHSMLAAASRVIYVSEPPYAPEKMEIRNRYMVDHSTRLLAAWNGDKKGGTANCVRYAWSRIPVFNVWREFLTVRGGAI